MGEFLVGVGFFGGVGCLVWLMICRKKNQSIKKSAIGLGVCFIVLVAGGALMPDENTTNAPVNVQQPSGSMVSSQITAATEYTTVNTVTNSTVTSTTRTYAMSAATADSELQREITIIDNSYDKLIKSMQSGNTSTIYKEAKGSKELCSLHIRNQLPKIEAEGIFEYYYAVEDYIVYVEDLSNKLMKYVDNPSESKLYDISNRIDEIEKQKMIIASERIKFCEVKGIAK